MESLYLLTLALHNVLRWVVVILGIVVVVLTLLGWLRKKEWTDRVRKFVSYYAISLDIQLVLGILLYFILSPMTRNIMQDFGGAMRAGGDSRFFGVEHIFTMLIAWIFAHLASIFAKRGATDAKKYRNAFIWDALSLILIFVAIPWWRPFVRLPF
jgi:hypothetical protein